MARSVEQELARIREVAEEISRLGPMLVGTLTKRPNRKKRRDGSEYVSSEYSTFQYKGADGRRKWKRIPRGAEGRVRKLIQTGARYRVLEREYRGRASELGLLDAAKKNG
jgi:hypothetical protein